MLLPLTMKLGFFVLTFFHFAPIDVMGYRRGGGTKVSQVLLHKQSRVSHAHRPDSIKKGIVSLRHLLGRRGGPQIVQKISPRN